MIIYFAGDGVTKPIRPEEVLENQDNIGTLLAYYKIFEAKTTRSSIRFRAIKKHGKVKTKDDVK